MNAKLRSVLDTTFDTIQEARKSPQFFLDVTWLPEMLCERKDGKYEWIGLGNYSGSDRGPMTKQEVKEALESASKINCVNPKDPLGPNLYEYARGIEVRDGRKP